MGLHREESWRMECRGVSGQRREQRHCQANVGAGHRWPAGRLDPSKEACGVLDKAKKGRGQGQLSVVGRSQKGEGNKSGYSIAQMGKLLACLLSNKKPTLRSRGSLGAGHREPW